MPVLKKETIEELQKISQENGRDLSFAEASEVAYGLVGYFDLLAKINHKMTKKYEQQ